MFEIKQPDILGYEEARGLSHIDQRTYVLPELPEIVRKLGLKGAGLNFLGEQNDRLLPHLRLIERAERSSVKGRSSQRHLGFFPGSTLPGPSGTEQHVGSTAYARWLHAIQMKGRGFDLSQINDHGRYTGKRPLLATQNPLPLKYWVDGIEVPFLQLVRFGEGDNKGIEDLEGCVEQATGLFNRFLGKGTSATLKYLHTLQNPFTPAPKLKKKYLDLAKALFEMYGVNERDHPLPIAMQVQQTVAYLSTVEEYKGIHSFNCQGVYFETYAYPFERLKAAELVQHERVVQELETLLDVGAFAPLLIEEHGFITDGTHRHASLIIFHMLHALQRRGISPKNLEKLRKENKFLERNHHYRIAVEVLAYLQEEQPSFLGDVKRFSGKTKPPAYVPIVLGMEAQACAVEKRPFDLEGKVIGLPSPHIYRGIQKAEGRLALDARGPYHRCDRAVIPWLRIIENGVN